MTLEELYSQVKDTKKTKYPKIDDLISGKYKVIAEGKHDTGIVKVYETGYILYIEDNKYTIFHITDVYGVGFSYTTQLYQDASIPYRKFNAEFFNDKDWLFRVVMAGNDRIVHNNNVNYERNIAFRYSGIAEDISELCYIPDYLQDNDDDADTVSDKIEQVKSMVSPNLWSVFVSIKVDGELERNVAAELHITQQAVSKRYRKACEQIPQAGKRVNPD